MTAPFTVRITAEIPLAISEIWPDGDGPKNPSEQQVAEFMETFSLRELLDGWNFRNYLEIEVDGALVRAR